MEHYVTLFDSFFLPQGLALQRSMERHAGDYTLWILCMDDKVHDVLFKLDLSNVRLLKLSQLETAELLAIKSARTKGEYCWTLTPFAPRFVFDAAPDVLRVTYLDADMWFRQHPAQIFREFERSGKQVLITDHAYSPEHDQSEFFGQYCVQFMIFNRHEGEVVRKWWESKCIEWCYARSEDGKFGDQKYLDDWPVRFDKFVHVLENKELLLAPWNATRFPYGNAICWHFHSLRIVVRSPVKLFVEYGQYFLPKCTRDNVYKKYLDDLSVSISWLVSMGVSLPSQKKLSYMHMLKLHIKSFVKRLYFVDASYGSTLRL